MRKKIDALGKPIRLEIDGGVKADNIAEIAAAGADTFVAGSAIFDAPDYASVIAKMRGGGSGAMSRAALAIRTATPEDAELLHELVTALAVYEREPDAVKASVEDLRNSLFGPGATAHALICEQAGQAVGFAVYFFNYLDLAGPQWPVPGRPVRAPGASW